MPGMVGRDAIQASNLARPASMGGFADSQTLYWAACPVVIVPFLTSLSSISAVSVRPVTAGLLAPGPGLPAPAPGPH